MLSDVSIGFLFKHLEYSFHSIEVVLSVRAVDSESTYSSSSARVVADP